jgi:hypothetical protein
MNVNERVDALTEQEAKAALEWYINKLSIFQAVYQESWKKKAIDMDALQESTLDMALKETQK